MRVRFIFMQGNRYFEASKLYAVVRELIQNSGWRRQKDEYLSNLSKNFICVTNLFLVAFFMVPLFHYGHHLIQVNPRILP